MIHHYHTREQSKTEMRKAKVIALFASNSSWSVLIMIQVIQNIPKHVWLLQYSVVLSWWRHQMETFSALLALCAGISPVTSEFPSQKTVTQSFDVFFDLCLNKRLSKKSRRQWFET